MLAKQAFDNEFSTALNNAIKDMISIIRESCKLSEERMRLIPILNQQRFILQEKRAVYAEIIRTNMKNGFKAKVEKALKFHMNLKTWYFMTDFLNEHEANPIKRAIRKFFIEAILLKLKESFVRLNNAVLEIVT